MRTSNAQYTYQPKGLKQSKYLKKTENGTKVKQQISENTKLQLRNQMLDLELLRLPSIGPEEIGVVSGKSGSNSVSNGKTGKNFIPTKKIIHPPNTATKLDKPGMI
jgi:hypothetical protein